MKKRAPRQTDGVPHEGLDIGIQSFCEGVAAFSPFGDGLFDIVNSVLLKHGLQPVYPRGQCACCEQKGTKKLQGYLYCKKHYDDTQEIWQFDKGEIK